MLADTALVLISCFLASKSEALAPVKDAGLWRPAAIAVEPAPTVLPPSVRSCFLPALIELCGFSAGRTIELPVALAPALRLLACLSFSSTAIFVLGARGGFCRPIAPAAERAELAFPFSSCLGLSSAAAPL